MEKKFRKEVIENFRSLKLEDLKEQGKGLKEELATVQFKLRNGQSDQIASVRRLRKTVARLNTVLREKQGS